MANTSEGCARPVTKVIDEEKEHHPISTDRVSKEKQEMSAQVGKKAPDFEAPAYHKGKFERFKLSDHLGHWILLCFYPGDFTFV